MFPKLPSSIKLVSYKEGNDTYTFIIEDDSCIHLFINNTYQESFIKDTFVTRKVFWDFVDEAICQFTNYSSEGKVKNLLMAAAENMDSVYVSDF